jgi:hypothetical protein
MDPVEIGHVVAVVPQRGGVDWQHPDAIHAQLLEIIELARQPLQIANPVSTAICKCPDEHFVIYRILVPKRFVRIHLSSPIQKQVIPSPSKDDAHYLMLQAHYSPQTSS